jgi:4-carboxymuconolactone decarboxylase
MGINQSGVPEDQLLALATGQAGVLEALARMQVGLLERSRLDEETYLLVRVAALVATDGAPVSYRAHLGGADRRVVSPAKVLATLVAIAPLVGSARVLSAASKLATAGILVTGPEQSSAAAAPAES